MDLYMDCLFTSGLLIEELWEYEVYIIRMIKINEIHVHQAFKKSLSYMGKATFSCNSQRKR